MHLPFALKIKHFYYLPRVLKRTYEKLRVRIIDQEASYLAAVSNIVQVLKPFCSPAKGTAQKVTV